MQTLKGIVTAIPAKNSVIVAVSYIFHHRKYKKTVKKTTKVAAHNEIEEVKIGDTVHLVMSKPYSKTQHFRTVQIVLDRAKPGQKLAKKQKKEVSQPAKTI